MLITMHAGGYDRIRVKTEYVHTEFYQTERAKSINDVRECCLCKCSINDRIQGSELLILHGNDDLRVMLINRLDELKELGLLTNSFKTDGRFTLNDNRTKNLDLLINATHRILGRHLITIERRGAGRKIEDDVRIEIRLDQCSDRECLLLLEIGNTIMERFESGQMSEHFMRERIFCWGLHTN